jgi:flagellar assembly protein FliH
MSSGSSNAPEVLRGIRFDSAPLRLGRARASGASAPAAQALVDEAEEDQALRQAHAQALRQGREQGHEEGLRAGRAEGLREGRAQAAEEVRQAVQRALAQAEAQWNDEHERLGRIAQHAQAAVADLLWSAQDEMVVLCHETLCRVVGASAVQPAFVRAQLAHLLAQHGAPDVVLHVHPQDAELLQRPGSGAVPVIGDAQVALGGCILKSTSGALDARLDAILEACKAALLEARASGSQDCAGETA